MNTTTQAQVVPPASETYAEVREMQLEALQEQPFSMPFLFWMYGELLEEVFKQLPQKYHERVDVLLMFNTYLTIADMKELLTGMQVETLTDVVAQATHMMNWE